MPPLWMVFFVAGLAYYLGLKRLGAGVIRTLPLNFQEQLHILKKVKLTGIIGVPSNLIKFAKYCVNQGVNTKHLEVTKLILIGESIRDQNGQLNSLGKMLKQLWPETMLISTYGNTEIATSFCECQYGQGGHGHTDLCVAEIIDESGKVLANREIGELVVTTFSVQGMPLLRYRTGDITFINREKCLCGRTTPRIGPILARRENMLKVGGVSIYPLAIEDGILAVDGILDYVIIAYNHEDSSDKVKILITAEKVDPYLPRRVAEQVRAKSRITPKIEVVEEGVLRKLQYGSGSNKGRRFIDQRNNIL